MKKSFLITIVFSFYICACASNGDKLALSREKINLIIEDLYIAEAALTKAHSSLRDSLGIIYKDQIIKIHKIDENILDQIVKQTTDDLDLYYQMNDSITKSLNESIEN